MAKEPETKGPGTHTLDFAHKKTSAVSGPDDGRQLVVLYVQDPAQGHAGHVVWGLPHQAKLHQNQRRHRRPRCVDAEVRPNELMLLH